MRISSVDNNFRPAFNGTFAKTPALCQYVDSLNAKDFDAFVKNHELMKSRNDKKVYSYKLEEYKGRTYGCIVDEKGEYIARECIGYEGTNGPIQLREYEDGLFKDLFIIYANLDLKDRKRHFLQHEISNKQRG